MRASDRAYATLLDEIQRGILRTRHRARRGGAGHAPRREPHAAARSARPPRRRRARRPAVASRHRRDRRRRRRHPRAVRGAPRARRDRRPARRRAGGCRGLRRPRRRVRARRASDGQDALDAYYALIARFDAAARRVGRATTTSRRRCAACARISSGCDDSRATTPTDSRHPSPSTV